jgi:hypothetical protein
MTDDTTPVIRPYTPADREAVRRICCDTAYRNQGAELYFEDREIHADYWSSYYTDVTPEEVRVIELGGEVIGYLFGCHDSRAHRRAMARRIVPWAIARALWRLARGRYKNPVSRRYLRFMLTKAPAEEPRVDIDAFPAHFHFNVTEAGRGHRLYTTIVRDFVDRLEARGITRLHGFITEPAEGGVWSRFDDRFSRDHGDPFLVRVEKPTRINEVLLGDPTPMVNRAWGIDTKDYRAFLRFLGDRFRM